MDARVTRFFVGGCRGRCHRLRRRSRGGARPASRRNTVKKGRDELRGRAPRRTTRSCAAAAGGGGRRHEDVHPELLLTLKKLVDPATRGDLESPLRWTAKSAVVLSSLPLSHLRNPSQRQDRRQAAPTTGLQPAGGEEDRSRARNIQIATRSSSTSMRRRRTVFGAAFRSSPSTPRRRNSSATSRTAVANGVRRISPSFLSTCTTSSALARQGDSVRGLRCRRQPRLRQRRHGPRHARVRRHVDRSVVEANGRAALPGRHGTLHHGRRGGQQRLPVPRMEGRTTTPRR